MPVLSARVASAAVLAADLSDDGRSWIELIPTADKARNGKWYFTITRADLDVYAASVRANAGKVPIDRDHEGDTGGSTRAAGWFTGQTQVVDRGDPTPDGGTALHAAVWAEVEWTPRAVQEIRDGEFRYMSPVFTFEEQDPKTGLMTRAKDIVASTLTNRPYFDEMAPVTAAVVWAPEEGFEQLRQRVYDALNPGGMEHAEYWVMDVAPGKALVCEYDSDRHWVVPFTVADNGEVEIPPSRDWQAAEQEWVAAANAALTANRAVRPFTLKETSMDTTVLAKTLGLAEDATEDQITAAATKAAEDAAKTADLETKVTELEAAAAAAAGEKTELEELREQVQAERKLRLDGEAKAAVEQAVREFRVTPAMGEVLTAQFDGNVDGLKAVLAAAAAGSVKGGKPVGVGADTDGDTDVLAAEQELGDGKHQVQGADLHVEALKIMAAAGKPADDPDAYADALVQAERNQKTAAA